MVPQAEEVQVALGGLVNLVCNVEAWPRPKMKWEKDGKEIFDSSVYSMVIFQNLIFAKRIELLVI